jgi:predicted DNA-binding protein with PD1-like motif
MTRKPYEHGRVFVGRIPHGADLLETLARIANEESIAVGTVTVNGVVERLELVVLDPSTRLPQPVSRPAPFEIASLAGTISQFKGRSLPRLSGVFVAADGETRAGTLARGTIAYACEAVVTELRGGTLSRDFDMETGLALWKSSSFLVDPPESSSDVSET